MFNNNLIVIFTAKETKKLQLKLYSKGCLNIYTLTNTATQTHYTAKHTFEFDHTISSEYNSGWSKW